MSDRRHTSSASGEPPTAVRSMAWVEHRARIYAAMIGSAWWMDYAIKKQVEGGNGSAAEILTRAASEYASALERCSTVGDERREGENRERSH